MTREEEIIEAGVDFTMQHYPVCIAGAAFEKEMREFNRNRSFETGAKWADKTMINKVCEWLKENAYLYVSDLTGSLEEDKLIEHLKQAMRL